MNNRLISERCWNEIVRKMPIPCVDTIVSKNGTFLMGWRIIKPYRNVWALLGGRIFRGESFIQTATRQCKLSGIIVHKPYFIGVYPVIFPSRHDVTVCMAAEWKSGNLKSTGELSRYRWFKINQINEIKHLGSNYRKMLMDWRKMIRKKY